MSSQRNPESRVNFDHRTWLSIFNPFDDVLYVFGPEGFDSCSLLFFYLKIEVDKTRRR